MSRRTDQLNRIEASLSRLEETLAAHAAERREQTAATRVDLHAVRESAESAHAGVQALADMLPSVTISPETAAGGVTAGEPVTAARRAPKTLKPKGM